MLKTEAAILPRIVALGDIDEDELAFAEEAEYGGVAPLDIPPKLGELERRLTLAHLVAAGPNARCLAPLVVGGPASTLALAGDLARLIDDMVTRGVDWGALDRLVPNQFDEYWQYSLDFLQIAREVWPAFLAEIKKIEPAARRDMLIDAEAARLTKHHDGPVIAAGSTGSMPATAKFLHVGRQAEARRRGAAGARHRSRRGVLAIIGGTGTRTANSPRRLIEPSAICHACAARSLRHQTQRR